MDCSGMIVISNVQLPTPGITQLWEEATKGTALYSTRRTEKTNTHKIYTSQELIDAYKRMLIDGNGRRV